jgi:hypothetical protein
VNQSSDIKSTYDYFEVKTPLYMLGYFCLILIIDGGLILRPILAIGCVGLLSLDLLVALYLGDALTD